MHRICRGTSFLTHHQVRTLSDVSEEKISELTGCSYSCSFTSYQIEQKSGSGSSGDDDNKNPTQYTDQGRSS